MRVCELYEAFQPRIESGIDAQNAVIKHLEHEFGTDFELISTAGVSLSDPDIVCKIHGVKTQIEAKNRATRGSTVKVYEATLVRGDGGDRMMNAFARSHSGGKAKTVEQYIDLLRKTNKSVGWRDDPGVTTVAGTFGMRTEDANMITLVRRYIMDMLNKNHDDYFAIYTKNTGETDMYDTKSKNKQIKSVQLPPIKRIVLGTYGSRENGALRLAIKVIFKK